MPSIVRATSYTLAFSVGQQIPCGDTGYQASFYLEKPQVLMAVQCWKIILQPVRTGTWPYSLHKSTNLFEVTKQLSVICKFIHDLQ